MIRKAVPLIECAAVVGLLPEEVEWAVEEFGLCNTDRYVVVGEHDAFPDGAPAMGQNGSRGARDYDLAAMGSAILLSTRFEREITSFNMRYSDRFFSALGAWQQGWREQPDRRLAIT